GSSIDTPPPPPALATRPLTSVTVDAEMLVADDAGLYWVTSANQVWALPVGDEVPHLLATAGAPPYRGCGYPGRLVGAGPDLFWFAQRSGGLATTVLHRTAKDGGSDDVLTAGLKINGGYNLAADDARVYWTEYVDVDSGGGGVIRTLPRGAAPG